MDTELSSPPHDGGDNTMAAFKKPSNDGPTRNYRRRALADDGSSSSDGNPEHNQSRSPKHRRGDTRKDYEPGYAKKDDRREHDRSRYNRDDRNDRYSRDDNYGSKRDEYNIHERDAPRFSRESRSGHHSDFRRVETEYSRSRNDSDRHSRDKYRGSGQSKNSDEKCEDISSSRRHADSRLEDKDKGYMRGRNYQDEKKGSRWSYGDRHSRDDRKKNEEPEINKEKDVHVKSSSDRSDGKYLAAENRNTHSKRLKGFSSKKFTTHRNTDDEKQTSSSLKPGSSAGNEGSTLQSHSKETEITGDVDAAKVVAMHAAELVNKNLVGMGYLTTYQKKKL